MQSKLKGYPHFLGLSACYKWVSRTCYIKYSMQFISVLYQCPCSLVHKMHNMFYLFHPNPRLYETAGFFMQMSLSTLNGEKLVTSWSVSFCQVVNWISGHWEFLLQLHRPLEAEPKSMHYLNAGVALNFHTCKLLSISSPNQPHILKGLPQALFRRIWSDSTYVCGLFPLSRGLLDMPWLVLSKAV